MCYRRLIIIFALIVTVTVVVWPQPVHAFSVAGTASTIMLTLLDLIRVALEFVGSLLKMLIAKMGEILQSVLSLKLTYGGPTVYAVWKIFRDMCNMLFIVLFIVVVFSTIFDSLLKNHSFSYKNALVWVIIAAIAINFSLAIGQTVVWAGNYATGMVLGLMPSNVGAQVVTSLNVPALFSGNVTTPAALVPPVSDIPFNQLTPTQQKGIQTWLGYTAQGNQATSQGLVYLRACLESSKKSASICYNEATVVVANASVTAFNQAAKSQNASAINWMKDIYGYWSSAAKNGLSNATLPAQTENAPTDLKTQLGLIINALLTDFLLLVLATSFLAVVIFMVIRIPAIWLLLAMSSIAFFTIAMPNSDTFKKWFYNLLGWCIFSPLYLFIIYIGLFFISQSGSLTASLTDPQMPFLAGTFGNILFFLMAGFIFIGGAKYAFDFSFKTLSPQAGKWFGVVGGALGISEGSNFGINTIAQRFPVINTPNAQALAERAKQFGGDITAGLRGRAPKLFGPEKEALAQARERFGVRGGAQEVAKLARSRIESEQKIIETDQKLQLQKLQNARAQAKTDEARSALDGKIKKLKEAQVINLKAKLNSGNRDIRLAAGELLMNDGKLDARGLQQLGSQYQSVSQEALAGFIERRDTQLVKDAGKRTYTKGKEAEELASFLALITDPKQANKYIESAMKGKNKFWALEAGTSRHLIMGPDGKTPVTLTQKLEEEADKFNATDLVHAEAYFHQHNEKMPKSLELQYSRSLLTPKRLSQMIQNTRKDKDQVRRIVMARRQTDGEIMNLTRDVRDQTDQLNQTTREMNSLSDTVSKEARRKDVRKIQTNLEALRSRLTDLKRPIKEKEPKEEEKKPEKKEEKEEENASKEPKK